MNKVNESQLESAAVEWLGEGQLDWEYMWGPEIGPGGEAQEREGWDDVVLEGRLRDKLTAINPDVPANVLEDVIRKVLRPESVDLIQANREFHQMLVDGIDVVWHEDGAERTANVKLIDGENIEANDFLAVNQFTVKEGKYERRADVVLFVNGLPLAVMELKSPSDENATIADAYQQLQTYKAQIPSLFVYDEVLVISDGYNARFGTITAGWDRFMPWKTVDGEHIEDVGALQLRVLIQGMFEKRRFLDYVQNFVTFEDDGKKIVKKAAGYHQYWAVNKAVDCTVEASQPAGDRKIGVVWHTQGSGKSLSMMFYAGKIVKNPAMENPTLVVLTDRNDLDGQLFDTFAYNKALLRQTPLQAESRNDLQEKLQRVSGGVIFTTIQKFDDNGELSDRRNIVVIADEAHRSQYGFEAKINRNTGEIKYGFAQYVRNALPNASFIGFTGTPVELKDKSTRNVFGDDIDTYDIQRAVDDEATVPIYYQSRLARLKLNDEMLADIDAQFDEITEDQEVDAKEQTKQKWARIEAMVGNPSRVAMVAGDIINHFEQRQDALTGKAMIVCMSRRICVDMYNAIVKLRPGWHSEDDKAGKIKIVMSGAASDEESFQPHIRHRKTDRDAISKRFKDPKDELEIVIVRDMWLTGFDCPCMHTMYIDKPMGGHNLMQAIARVNRKFGDKPGGLVVDYIGIAASLQKALQVYTESGGTGKATETQSDAVEMLFTQYEVVKGILERGGIDCKVVLAAEPSKRMCMIAEAVEFILGLDPVDGKEGKQQYAEEVAKLSKLFALSVGDDRAMEIRDEVCIFKEIQAVMNKATVAESSQTPVEMEHAIRQLISEAVISTSIVDIFEAAGMEKPDISILSEDFLDEVRNLPQKRLAIELLRKLINGEIKTRLRKNIVQAKAFSDMLTDAVLKYQNQSLTSAQIIEELIRIAKQIQKVQSRGQQLGLTDDEVAFYDALSQNDSATKIIGNEKLRTLAHILVERVRNSVSIDWQVRETARAKIRVMVKRILREYGYPPDLEKVATELVLKQTEQLCKDWV